MVRSFAAEQLDALISELRKRTFTVVGPRLEQGAIVYGELLGANDLPQGWTDLQEAGRYRLRQRKDQAYFGYAVGPHSWKKYLFPPEIRLWQGRRTENGFVIDEGKPEEVRYAFLGVRPCELQAILIQDRVFLEGSYTDPIYRGRREQCCIIAVECGVPAATCFCTSMNTGPGIDEAQRKTCDLALTEIVSEKEHLFLARAESPLGKELLKSLETKAASKTEERKAEEVVSRARDQMGRQMNTENIRTLLYDNAESQQWDAIAERCLSCTNCTMVCPTCFCHSVEDTNNLRGDTAERVRRWDSCFALDFSAVHGGNVRRITAARYRQWMTHKLASWIDQYGTSGCVGCGRCISWCPVGIDITEEVNSLQNQVTP